MENFRKKILEELSANKKDNRAKLLIEK